jgi:hypothetical protein
MGQHDGRDLEVHRSDTDPQGAQPLEYDTRSSVEIEDQNMPENV